MMLFSIFRPAIPWTVLYVVVSVIYSLLRRYSRSDTRMWGIALALISIGLYFSESFHLERPILITILFILWGLGIFVHLFVRSTSHERLPISLFRTLKLTVGSIELGVLALLALTPLLYVDRYAGGSLGLLDLLGTVVWFVGFAMEKIPRGKNSVKHGIKYGWTVAAVGVWIIALSIPGASWTIISPLAIFAFAPRILGTTFE